MLPTLHLLQQGSFPPLRRGRLETLQVNLGYRCNQQCLHCHVDAGPNRQEVMADAVIDQLLLFCSEGRLQRLDLTGGAPELHPRFRELVSVARSNGITVTDRCNLTILSEVGQESLARFLADQQVEVVASLPCYLEENVDSQRGAGTYSRSIEGLRTLNQLGYGDPAGDLVLNLVYNPAGPALPPDQSGLEQAYRERLGELGIVFTSLYTIANMPIKRFGSSLISRGQFDEYMTLLRENHRDENLSQVMCRNLISVDWQGLLYDCDFNQMLGLPLANSTATRPTLEQLFQQDGEGWPIAVADHCHGCTAGQGSSCGGAFG
jgi:radical SAM/Cys-rich protein